jgi:hypothetical protein
MNRFFSYRHGFGTPDVKITIRKDAPDFLRFQVASIARNCELSPRPIRAIVSDILWKVPDPTNWSEY